MLGISPENICWRPSSRAVGRPRPITRKRPATPCGPGYGGPLGRVAFDEKGDPRFFTAVLFQTQKGNQVVVYPKDRALARRSTRGTLGREVDKNQLSIINC